MTLPADLFHDYAALAKKFGSFKWAVKKLIPSVGNGMIFGGSGAFKSFIAIDYAMHRAYGLPWLGLKTERGFPCILAAEGGTGLKKRIDAWHAARNMDPALCPFTSIPMPLTLREHAVQLRREIEKLGLPITDIIPDTFSQVYTGVENSNDDIASYLRACTAELVLPLRIVLMHVHHTGHEATKRPRGGSAIIANTEFLLGVYRTEGERFAVMEHQKAKDEDPLPPVTFHLTRHLLGHDLDGDSITSLSASHVVDPRDVANKVNDDDGPNRRIMEIASRNLALKVARKEFLDTFKGTPAAGYKAWERSTESLIAKNLIKIEGGLLRRVIFDISTENE